MLAASGSEAMMAEASDDAVEQRPAPEPQDRGREDVPATRRQQAPRRRRNWDAYTALVATLIGLLALLVSAYTAYVQRQQLRAQVWPHLTIVTMNSPPQIGLAAINGGTGPALVTAVRVTVDKRPVATWAHAQKAMGVEPGGITLSQFGSTVLPPGKDMTILRPDSADVASRFEEQFLSGKHAISITACYCSVLDECWMVTSDTVPEPISGADGCPISAAERFKQ
jgi:hypothetical protein